MYRIIILLFIFVLFACSSDESVDGLNGGKIVTSCPIFLENSEISEIHWYLHDDLARLRAENPDKNILIYFSSKTCGACVRLEESILDHQATVDTLSEFYVTIKVSDETISREEVNKLKEKYGVIGFPALVILENETMDELARATGFYESPGSIVEYLRFFCAYR